MAPTNEEVKKATEEMITDHEQGDTYDEDTGKFLGSLDLQDPEGLPASIGVFYKNYWYVFKPDSRYKNEAISPLPTVNLVGEVKDIAVELERSGETKPAISAEDSIFPKGR